MNWLKHFMVVVLFSLYQFFNGSALDWAVILLGSIALGIFINDIKKSGRDVSVETINEAVWRGGTISLSLVAILVILSVVLLSILGEDVNAFLVEVSKGMTTIEGSFGDFILGLVASVLKFIIIYNSYAAIFSKRKKKNSSEMTHQSKLEKKNLDFDFDSLSHEDQQYVLKNK